MAAAGRHGRLEAVSENSGRENDDTGPRGPWPGPGQGPVPARPPLRRNRRSRVIAGVCGGLGRHLDIDPVLFRILFALLTVFGGFGLLLYAAAWLFVPDEDEQESEGHRLLRGGRGTLAAVAVAVLVVLGFLAMIRVLSDGFWHAVPLLLLAAAVIAVLLWLGESGRRQPPGESQYVGGGWGPAGPDQPRPWWQRPVPAPPGTPMPETAGAGAGAAPDEPRDTVPESTDPEFLTAPFASSAPEAGFGWGAGAAGSKSNRTPRPRRVGGLVLSGALLALGVVGVLAQAGAISVGWTAGLALAVMAVGAGMVVGGFFGRARALIPLGLVMTVPLILASAIGVPLRGETGNTSWTPVSAAAVVSPYDLAAGRGDLDLSAVDPNGGTVRITAHVGFGQMIVTVPDNVALVVTAHVGVGRMLFTDGSQHSGLDVTHSFSSPAAGASKGTIVLDLKAGAGDVEVQRAS